MVTEERSATARLREDPARLDGVFGRLRDDVAKGVVPTAALAVGDADGGIRSEAFGGRRRQVTIDDYFFLASVTKPIFATAFMLLVEDGQVGLDDPIANWLPEFDEGDKRKVTARQLLTHTSGVPEYPLDRLARERPSVERQTRATLAAALIAEPGTRYEYCTSSYLLLAAMIERITSTRYRAFLHDRVLEPLDMRTTFDPRRAGRKIVSVEGVGLDNAIVRFLMLRYLAGTALPGGGLFGTLDDMLRFGAAALRPRQLDGRAIPTSRETFALMGEDQLHGMTGMYDGEEREVHHGLGWGKPTLMHDLPGSSNVVSHGGASGTRLWIDPDSGLVFVYFTNVWSADRSPENAALFGTYEALEAA